LRRTVGLVEEQADDNAADDYGKVRRQTASWFEFPKQSELIVSQSGKNPFAQGVAFLCPQSDFPFGDRVVDDMQNQSEEPVHKVFPSPILPGQTTVQKRIVQMIGRHVSH